MTASTCDAEHQELGWEMKDSKKKKKKDGKMSLR